VYQLVWNALVLSGVTQYRTILRLAIDASPLPIWLDPGVALEAPHLGGRVFARAAAVAAIAVLGLACTAQAATKPAACRAPAAAGGEWPAYGHDAENTRQFRRVAATA
jgi:hypothetical protein